MDVPIKGIIKLSSQFAKFSAKTCRSLFPYMDSYRIPQPGNHWRRRHYWIVQGELLLVIKWHCLIELQMNLICN